VAKTPPRKMNCRIYGTLVVSGVKHDLNGIRFNRETALNIMAKGPDWEQNMLWLGKTLNGRYNMNRRSGRPAPPNVGYFDARRDSILITEIANLN